MLGQNRNGVLGHAGGRWQKPPTRAQMLLGQGVENYPLRVTQLSLQLRVFL